METTKIPLSSCVESSYQNRKELGDVSGLARSIEVNGQITPLIVVADGGAYQLVAGHRRTAAMKSLGLEEANAYVMDGWDDARIAQILNAENNHRRELTEAERGRGIQTMLSLGVPVADAAVSADIPEEKAESYVRGTKLVPTDAVNLDIEAVALMGEYDDVLTEDDVVAILSKKGHWERAAICQAARARAAAESARAELEERGIRIVEDSDICEGGYHHCDGDCGHAGLVATVSANRWCESASVHFYCDDKAHVHQPTPEEVAETEAFLGRKTTLDAMGGRIAEFAKSVYPKFPAKGQLKLRQWAHEAFEACYECEPDDAWEGFKEPKAKALDQFILMRIIPACVPDLSQSASSSAATSRGRAIWKSSASVCRPATDRRSPRAPSIPYDLPRVHLPSARPVLGVKLPEGATPWSRRSGTASCRATGRRAKTRTAGRACARSWATSSGEARPSASAPTPPTARWTAATTASTSSTTGGSPSICGPSTTRTGTPSGCARSSPPRSTTGTSSTICSAASTRPCPRSFGSAGCSTRWRSPSRT